MILPQAPSAPHKGHRPPPTEAKAPAAPAARPAIAYLHPGQLFVSAEPAAVTTILGSCVAVCLWDRVLRLGGMNHFLLPHWPGEAEASARFGNVAMGRLLDGLVALGSQAAHLQGKVFGGACVVEAFRARDLGSKNVEVARRFLQDARIAVVHEDVGGRRARKVTFHVEDGATSVKLLEG